MKPTSEGSTSGDNAQGIHWSGDRLHADVHRAVGGSLNLLREVARISEHMDSVISAEWMVKRVQFLAYELQSRYRGSDATPPTEAERLADLNRYFFQEQRFQCLTIHSELSGNNDPSAALLLSRVLGSRKGSAPVLAVLYAFIAKHIDIDVEFVDLKPACFLKWTEKSNENRARYIDITRSGAILTSDELIETLHTRFRMTNFSQLSLLEPYAFETYVADCINELKIALRTKGDPEKLLFLQNALIAYQPSNMNLLAERALLHRRLGNFKSALSDLKRFFTFYEREKAPPELIKLHEELTQMQ